MNHFSKVMLGAVTVAAAAIALPGAASSGVSVGVSVGAPGYYYGPGFYPPGPCDAYSYYYTGDCGYPVYNGRVFINGVWVTGPHYYRWWGGQPRFWYRGGWHTWAGWHGTRWNWNHAPGWGWHNGRWNRAWGTAHWRGGRNWNGRAHWSGNNGWRGNVRVRDNVRIHENMNGNVRVHENVRVHDDGGKRHH